MMISNSVAQILLDKTLAERIESNQVLRERVQQTNSRWERLVGMVARFRHNHHSLRFNLTTRENVSEAIQTLSVMLGQVLVILGIEVTDEVIQNRIESNQVWRERVEQSSFRWERLFYHHHQSIRFNLATRENASEAIQTLHMMMGQALVILGMEVTDEVIQIPCWIDEIQEIMQRPEMDEIQTTMIVPNEVASALAQILRCNALASQIAENQSLREQLTYLESTNERLILNLCLMATDLVQLRQMLQLLFP